jgi:hypothetical protein
MSRPPLEVADIFRFHGEKYRKDHRSNISTVQHRAMRAIEQCRTAALGGHVDECDRCGHRIISYNSCRNRNCPKCQSSAAKIWLARRESELLPVPYFHIVFTVPKEVARISLGNQKVVYDILFRSVSQTLLTVGSNSFGGQIGFLAILHTWGQNMDYHPHIHCVVVGGALTSDHGWVKSRKHFFLPVAVLSKVFRGKFLACLRTAFRTGKLHFSGSLSHLCTDAAFQTFLRPAVAKRWVVYCKPPFAAPQQVLAYLGRYTHRIAISNRRLTTLENGIVTFRWKDYRDRCRIKLMSLHAEEFIRRFLMHVVPARFVRIRYYGFLSNHNRAASLGTIRSIIAISSDSFKSISTSNVHPDESILCPVCKQGKMIRIELITPRGLDSS